MIMDAYLEMRCIRNGQHSSCIATIITGQRMELKQSSGCIPYHPVSPPIRVELRERQ